jgi:hypothetical protein
VVGHPGALQRGRAVPVDRGARDAVEAQHDPGHPGDVEPLLAAGQPAADDQILYLGRIQLRYLGQHCRHDLGEQVVGPDGGQRSLERPADGRAGGRDDDGFWHIDASWYLRVSYFTVTGTNFIQETPVGGTFGRHPDYEGQEGEVRR